MKNLRRNEVEGRWFSTGFMVGGVESVDAGAHTLKNAVLIRPGEALGHGFWIDAEFCADIAKRGAMAGDKGMKARFGHPNMCSEALGTFLGRWKATRFDAETGRVTGDLHLSSTAAESPKGDLRKYVEEMAAKEPDHFGASIVFTFDQEACYAHSIQHGAVEKEDDYGKYLDFESFKSPDAANVKNLPHARCAELHAADLVDDPAATDGMFSGAGGLSLAAQMTEWLDTHPGVLAAINDEPELLNIVSRYSNELQPFLTRYTENLGRKTTLAEGDPIPPVEDAPAGDCPECGGTGKCPECNGSGMKPEPAEPGEGGEVAAEPADDGLAKAAAEVAKLTAERDGLKAEGEKAVLALSQAISERDVLKGKSEKAEAELTAIKAERDEALKKLAAIEAGSPPVSTVPAEKNEHTGSLMQRARKRK